MFSRVPRPRHHGHLPNKYSTAALASLAKKGYNPPLGSNTISANARYRSPRIQARSRSQVCKQFPKIYTVTYAAGIGSKETRQEV